MALDANALAIHAKVNECRFSGRVLLKSGYTASAAMANEILAVIEMLGGNRLGVMHFLGLKEEELTDINGRVPIEQIFALYNEGEKQTGVQNIGLRMAGRHHPIKNSIILHLFMSSATVGEALQYGVRYQQLITDAMEHELVTVGDQVRFSILPKDPSLTPPRHMVEAGFGSLTSFAKGALGERFTGFQVHFQHPEPEDISEHLALFGAHIQFGMARNEILMDKELLDHPMAGADAGLKTILTQQAEWMLKKLPQGGAFLNQFRGVLTESLPRGRHTIEQISQKLSMSVRTLQRRLSEEQTTFQAQLDQVRFHLAKNYLEDSQTSLFEVAYLLGFTEQSTFNRAFKRWTSKTPGEYRRR